MILLRVAIGNPLRLMDRSTSYHAWRAALVKQLASLAPLIEASDRSTRRAEVISWAHCDPEVWRRTFNFPTIGSLRGNLVRRHW